MFREANIEPSKSTTNRYDIIIVGAGPAGLSCALHLAQVAPELVPHTLILEKAHHPRPKLCAGGLVADAEILLQRLGLDVTEVPHVDAGSAHLDFSGRGLNIRVRKGHALRIIRRDEFDAWLAGKAKRAGIEIREGVAVTSVKADEDGVTVETDAGNFRARAVVGADGSNGILRGCILPDVPVHTARALEVLAVEPVIAEEPCKGSATPSSPKRKSAHDPQAAYFDFFCIPAGIAGYVWDFPTQVKGQPMRCWGVYDANILAGRSRPPLKAPLAEEMLRHGFQLEDLELKGHPVRCFDPRNRFAVPRGIHSGFPRSEV